MAYRYDVVCTHDNRCIRKDESLEVNGEIYHCDDDLPEEEAKEQEQLEQAA